MKNPQHWSAQHLSREINFDGETVINDEKIAAGFNEYFSTIGSKLSEEIKDGDIDPLSFKTVTHNDIFNFITIDEVIDALNLIQSKNPQDWMELVQDC